MIRKSASSPVLEETHYYPFGLTMSGISSNALKGSNYPENRKKYNGIEFTNDLDLDIYDAQLRNLDPQIGRWNQIDPKIESMEMWSPYVSNYDNPIRYNDFLGDEPGGPGPFQKAREVVNNLALGTVVAAAGVSNAFVSNHLLGAGRIDVGNTGLTGGFAITFQVAQKVGDAASVVAGIVESVAAGGGEVLSAGVATPVAIPLALEGVSTTAFGLKNAFTNPIRNIGEYSHEDSQRELPRKPNGEPAPDPNASGPHTRLGSKEGRKGTYNQAREFDQNGKPVKDIDFTDHGRPSNHPNPHEHPYVQNPSGGTPQHGPAQPLNPDFNRYLPWMQQKP